MGTDQNQLLLPLPAEIPLSKGWGPCGQERSPEHGHFLMGNRSDCNKSEALQRLLTAQEGTYQQRHLG